MRYLIVLLVSLGVFASCENGGLNVDLSQFEAMKSIEDIDLSNIAPKEDNVSYWQLREIFTGETDYTVVNETGTLCGDVTEPQACTEEFNELVSDTGFCWHGHPADSVYYIAASRQEEHELITTDDGVLEFLGEIDTEEDAMLYARALGYFWRTDKKQNGAIRAVEDGFELVVTELVSLCTPLQTDRVLIHIGFDGTVTELDRAVLSREPNMCA